MSPFVFRTGIPFGFLGFWGCLAVVSGALFVRGVRSSRRGRAVVGGLVLAGIVFVVATNVAAERDLDLNPVIRYRGEIAGLWNDGTAVLDLRSDATYECRGGGTCVELGPGGSWAWLGCQISFQQATGTTAAWRIVRYRHELRLTKDPDDFDSWDGHLSFRRVQPAESTAPMHPK